MIPSEIAELASVIALRDGRAERTEADIKEAYAITNAMSDLGWSWQKRTA